MKKNKILLSLSLFWMVLVGYLVWANGLLARGDKSFRWDEWIWFGIVPALVPYLFLYIWKPNIIRDIFKNDKIDD
jgi:hypothetical protein|tara:strand:+ start:124 stop:348 length:225 start_codon:yes stop_codon:yes gene_type:complete